MATRLNQLFLISPESFLNRTVLFSNDLATPESFRLMANKLLHHVDIEPVTNRSRVRLLTGINEYSQHSDVPMLSYVVPMEGVALVPKEGSPHTLVFIPEFTCCRLLVQDDEQWLRFSLNRDMFRIETPPETEQGSRYCDSINYWEFVERGLVGNIRGTAILFKQPEKPWRFAMQQIVGPAGAEVVRKVFARDLRYSGLITP